MKRIAFLLVASLLIGCGGGGGGGNSNTAPVANAGINQSVPTGTVVTLNGGGSSDADGDPLTYAWAFTSRPAGSTAALANATTVSPTFTADVAGSYVLTLVVNDGQVDSSPDTVSITAYVPNTNSPPVADAGTNQSVTTGAVVTLDGSGSTDANGDPLTYSWSFTSRPAGSAAALANATTVHPTFTPDVAGSYVLRLVVNDGQVDSAPDTVTITAFPDYRGLYSGTFHNATKGFDNVVDIDINNYSTTTLTGTLKVGSNSTFPFSSGNINGDVFHAVIDAGFDTTTMVGTFTSGGSTLSGTFLVVSKINGIPDQNGTFTVTKQ